MARPRSRDPKKDPAAFLGEELMLVRLAAEFPTHAALAAVLHVSRETITRAETGGQVPTDDLFRQWMDACNVSGEKREYLTRALAHARAGKWPIPAFIQVYLEREEEAEFLRLWSIILVPGLLQVQEYALAMYDLPGIDQDQAAATVDVYIGRQSLIEGPDAAQVIAVVDESVLYRLMGTPAIMVKQLDHLLEMSQRPNVTIQVTRGKGTYWGVVGSFSIASGSKIPDTLKMLTVEDQTIEDPTLTRKALILFERLRGHALTIEDSRAALMEARDHWNSQQ
jgi:transcriptional regulator with XRE-family HTH domain